MFFLGSRFLLRADDDLAGQHLFMFGSYSPLGKRTGRYIDGVRCEV
jgi:hypothetical protein